MTSRTAGDNILNALLQNQKGGPAVGKLAGGSGALPGDVAMWIREKDCQPVIWHTERDEYQFASELHAKSNGIFLIMAYAGFYIINRSRDVSGGVSCERLRPIRTECSMNSV